VSTAASSEFMSLCRAQLRLLAEGLGATASIVYITEELEGGGESKLLPVVVYPETEVAWSEMMTQIAERSPNPPSAAGASSIYPPERITKDSQPKSALRVPQLGFPQLASNKDTSVTTLAPPPAVSSDEARPKRHQLLLPLVSDGTIVGLLVTTRETQPWNATEQTEIQHIAQTIAFAGILDRKQNWLSQQLQQQQKIQLQQRDLFHNLLHQLRNPLTAIRTFGKLLIKRLQPEDPHRGFANSIVRESDRLQELLQHLENAIDVPLITTTRTDKLKPLPAGAAESPSPSANLLLPDAAFRIESCQLTDVLDPLIASADAIAQERDLSFYTHISRDLPLVQAHPAALREVLSNLIDNALKYTPAGGEVDVDVELTNVPPEQLNIDSSESVEICEKSYLQICIRDTGLGIPPQDLERLFTRHYRGVQAQGSIAGTGLGLAIAKELVTHMHGKIEVTSPPPGSDRGTEFILWLQLVNSSPS
jgi:signal transduction histidine kinase